MPLRHARRGNYSPRVNRRERPPDVYHQRVADLTAFILAGGQSRRMGQPKALLDFDGRTCLELVLEALRGYLAPIVVLGPNHDDIRKRVNFRGVKSIINHDVDRGQSHSLRVALMLPSAGTEAFLFMPVDYPLITASDVGRLVDAYLAGDSSKTIFIPSHHMRRGHPVLFRKSLVEELLQPNAMPRDVINRDPGRIAYVDFPEAYVLMDMDTPEDYVRCLAAYRARRAEKP